MKHLFIAVLLVFFCVSTASAAVKTFAWDQNTESDLKGYKAYRSITPDVALNPSNLWITIWKPGENPDPTNPAYAEYTLDADGNCEVSRNMLPDGIYYLAWTAFDEVGNESGLSNELYVMIFDDAPMGQWSFNWTKLTGVPDLVGYRLYVTSDGGPVRTGYGQHFWQGDKDVALPLVLDVPVGNWDSYLTSFDTGDVESDPTFNCNILLTDAPPPTPADYSCQEM